MLPLLLLTAAILEGPGLEFRQPQLAAHGHTVAMAFGSGRTIFVSTSHDGGATWSAPAKVADVEKLMLGRHRGPRIAFSKSGLVVSAIGASGDLNSWRSANGGRTWSPPVTVNDAPASAREGLHAMAAGADGRLYAVWLDLRAKGTRLYSSASGDGGAAWSKNVLVYESPDGTICQCCHPSLFVDARGGVHAMWRNALGGNRDLYLARSTDGGRTFSAAAKLGQGSWKLDACPMDGGGLSVASDGAIYTAWRREKEVFLAPAGGAETALEAGKDPAIALGRSGPHLIWSAGPAVHARIPGVAGIVTLDPDGACPNAIATPDGKVLAAWESKGRIVIRPLQP